MCACYDNDNNDCDFIANKVTYGRGTGALYKGKKGVVNLSVYMSLY